MRHRNLTIWLGLVGVTVGVLLGRPIVKNYVTEALPQPAATPDPYEVAFPHLEETNRRIASLGDSRLAPVHDFFNQAMGNTRDFADVAMGWGSKWRLMADYVPGTSKDRHQLFVRQQFESHVFRAEQLQQVITAVVSEYLAEMRSIENEMLVALRADLADFPQTYAISQLDPSQLQTKFDAAIAQAIETSDQQLFVDARTQIGAIIGGEVLTQVVVRLGISSGILGTGAATSWTTFGIGAVVGLAVDHLAFSAWEWWADPQGDLAHHINIRLDEMRELICFGDDEVSGLRSQFERLAQRRAQLRESAVLNLLSAN